MGKGNRQQRQNRSGAPAASEPVRRTRRWPAAVGILLVALALAVFLDWRLSGWEDATVVPDAAEPSATDEAAPEADAGLGVDDRLFAAAETHEELTALMTGLAARVVAAYPDDPTGYDLQGRICAYLGKSADAERAWERCLQLDPRRPEACNGLAKLAVKRGDDAAAEPLFRKALELHPAFTEVAQQLADLLTRTGRAPEAVAVLEQFVQHNPKATDILLLLAQTQLQLGTLDKARATFDAVIAVRPSSSEAHLGLGTVLTRLGHREEAREHLEKSRELRAAKPSAPPGLSAEEFDLLQSRVNCASSVLIAARIYESHGAAQTAARLGRQAITMDPKSLPARQFLISLYQDMEQWPEAIEICEDTVAADPRNPNLVLQLGALNTIAGRFDAAEVALKQVIQLTPDQARGYAGLAELYLQARRGGDESVRLAREAVRLEPTALHYALLGRVYAQLGDFAHARSALDEATKIEPENAAYRELRDALPASPRTDGR
jgi:Flp pilus assembly protein TadD